MQKLMTSADVAELLGYKGKNPAGSVHKLIKRGHLPAPRRRSPGGAYLFSPDEIEAYLRRCAEPCASGTVGASIPGDGVHPHGGTHTELAALA